MRYTIRYASNVLEEIRRLSPEPKQLIRNALREIAINPHSGIPLVDEFAARWKYRVKNYRIIYRMSEKKEIIVLLIDKRETVYDQLRELVKKQDA